MNIKEFLIGVIRAIIGIILVWSTLTIIPIIFNNCSTLIMTISVALWFIIISIIIYFTYLYRRKKVEEKDD